MRSSKNADSRTTGMATAMGAKVNAVATERAPKPTWDSPSPIIEYRLSTRLTPSSAAHRSHQGAGKQRAHHKGIGKQGRQYFKHGQALPKKNDGKAPSPGMRRLCHKNRECVSI